MTAAANPDARPGVVLVTVSRCRCAHLDELHDFPGGCRVELPPFEEEELPAWRCPCRSFVAGEVGPFLWHPATQSWAARGPRTGEPAA